MELALNNTKATTNVKILATAILILITHIVQWPWEGLHIITTMWKLAEITALSTSHAAVPASSMDYHAVCSCNLDHLPATVSGSLKFLVLL